MKDIRLILTSHGHFDHVGGVAALQRDSGGQVVASPSTAEALRLGGFIARPSFVNADNLRVWREFHLDLGRGLLERLLEQTEKWYDLVEVLGKHWKSDGDWLPYQHPADGDGNSDPRAT